MINWRRFAILLGAVACSLFIITDTHPAWPAVSLRWLCAGLPLLAFVVYSVFCMSGDISEYERQHERQRTEDQAED
jgi:hypothetical protein